MQRNFKTKGKYISLLLVICMIVTLLPLSSAMADDTVYKDGVYDTWAQATPTVKGGEICEVTDDGWLHVKAGAYNGNSPTSNPPADFINQDYVFDPAGGSLDVTLYTPTTTSTSNNRGGIYLGYTNSNCALLIGFDSGGWFWQRYGASGSPYYTSVRIAAPAPGSTSVIHLEWEDGKLTVATVNGYTMFSFGNTMPLDFTDISGLGTQIGFKCATYGTALTESWYRDIHYNGQAEADLYTVSGTATDGEGNPLANAYVHVTDNYNTFTDAAGAYTLENVPEGKYSVTVSKDGYFSASQNFSLLTADAVISNIELEKMAFGTTMISSDEMDVLVDDAFPRVINYTMKDSGKEFYGQTSQLDSILINSISVKTETLDVQQETDKITYKLAVKDETNNIDGVITAVLAVDKNNLSFDITEIVNNLDDYLYPIQTIEISNHSLISVRSTQTGANLKAALMSTNTTSSGDRSVTVTNSLSASSTKYMYAFVSNNELSAGLESNSDYGSGGASSNNYRVTANIVKGAGYTTLGLSSSAWYYHRKVTAKGNTYVIEENALPSVKVSIADDQNGDDQIDWQDGAIAFREIMHNPVGSEYVPELVAYRIAMNFGYQAQNPFLKTLDYVKVVSLHTDGLGQSIIHKGYGSGGHDSGHPDYGNIGYMQGGADEFNTLMEEASKLGARIGIHINASEMYPEAQGFSDDLVRRNSSGGLSYGWNWLDQGVGIDGLFDLASGQRAQRLAELKAQVGDNMDFIYLDVWGNNTSGSEDAWETFKISDQITGNGWRLAMEWGYAHEYETTFLHWAGDLTYGGYTSKGMNSYVMRFLRNHQKDTWNADYPSYSGAAIVPLLGGYNMKDFEGWQGRSGYDSYISNLYTYDISTKFLQHYLVTNWENGDAVTMTQSSAGTFSWTPDMKITLQDAAAENTVVIERESNDYTNDLHGYRSRTMTLNGKVILQGELPGGDGTRAAYGDETYLIPWYWDAETGEKVAAADEKLYHWNNLGGTTTWELPDEWESISSVVVYELSDTGKDLDTKQFVQVVDGEITLTANAKTPYVVYKNENDYNMVMTWSVGMHVVDAGFNSGNLDNWTIGGLGTADITRSQVGNQMLRMRGAVSVTQPITDLIPGQRYAIYVGVDNRASAKAWITVDSNETCLGSNYTGLSIARNYVKADAHSNSNATISSISRFQNMFVYFTAPEDGSDVTVTLKREGGADYTYFDDLRVVATGADNIKAVNEDGYVTYFEQDFENVDQGIYPFVLGGAEGVEDNRTHLSELHAPYTQAGWDVKKMDDVLEGTWSLKTNGLVQKSRLLYQTVPQNFRFKAGQKYVISFDYQSGSDGTYAVAWGNTEIATSTVATSNRTNLPMSLGTTSTYTFALTGTADEQSWFGIYSTSTAADLQGTTSNASNFGGYKDIVLDNLVIQLAGDTTELVALMDYANSFDLDDYDDADAVAALGTALEAAQGVLDNDLALQVDVDEAYAALEAALEDLIFPPVLDFIDGLDLSKYTSDSIAILDEALAVVDELLASDENLSVEEIKAVYDGLWDAIYALNPKTGYFFEPEFAKDEETGEFIVDADGKALLFFNVNGFTPERYEFWYCNGKTASPTWSGLIKIDDIETFGLSTNKWSYTLVIYDTLLDKYEIKYVYLEGLAPFFTPEVVTKSGKNYDAYGNVKVYLNDVNRVNYEIAYGYGKTTSLTWSSFKTVDVQKDADGTYIVFPTSAKYGTYSLRIKDTAGNAYIDYVYIAK